MTPSRTVRALALSAVAAGAVALGASGANAGAYSGAAPSATVPADGGDIVAVQYRGGPRGGYVGPRGGYAPRGYYGPRPGYGPRAYAGPGWGYRPWYRRPYYGTIIGGIALGTIIGATAYGLAPRPPRPDLCWYWADEGQSRGYWDYC